MGKIKGREAGCLEAFCCIIGLLFIFMPGKFLVFIASLWIPLTAKQLNGWSILASILVYCVFILIARKSKIYKNYYPAAGAYFLYSITADCMAICMLILYLICDGTNISTTIKHVFLKTLWL